MQNETWGIGPLLRHDAVNPCLSPNAAAVFDCPLNGPLAWEAKDIMQPATLVRDGRVYMLYRAEDAHGRLAGTSRIGLAVSDDGLHFRREPRPVLYPDHDALFAYEQDGGCEDPRVVEDDAGAYYLTYTAWNGHCARLCVATSPDLRSWRKHGLAFGEAYNGKYRDTWSKSGAIVCRREGDRLIATRINGRYWMYWGESDLYAATSDDLIHWAPVEHEIDSGKRLHLREGGYTVEHLPGRPALLSIMRPRQGRFDSVLVEPGPPALLTDAGILLIYNGCNSATHGDPHLPDVAYTPGQVLLDRNDPTAVLARSTTPLLVPERPYEIAGQTNAVCFFQGMTPFGGAWRLYYGTADSQIAVVEAVQPFALP